MMHRTIGAVFAIFQALVVAGPVAEPLITPGPLLKRDDSTDQYLIGYYFNTVYSTWSKDLCQTVVSGVTRTYTQSGAFYECCPIGQTCNVNIGCVGTSLVDASSSTYGCATEINRASATCIWDVMFASQGASAALGRWVYCAGAGDVGTTYYRNNPLATTTSTSSSSSTTTATPTPTPPPPPPKKSAPIGAIAGGAVGGVAILALAAIGLLLCLKKRNKNRDSQSHAHLTSPDPLKSEPSFGGPTPLGSPQFQSGGEMAKPAMVEHVSPMASPSPYPVHHVGQYGTKPVPFGGEIQPQQQYQPYNPSGLSQQHWGSPAPVEMDTPRDSMPPPQYGNLSPNPNAHS